MTLQDKLYLLLEEPEKKQIFICIKFFHLHSNLD